MNRLLQIALWMVLPAITLAQNNQSFMYSSGRIYVVIAVLVTIFIGIVLYLFKIDKNIKKLKNKDK
ncbi:MAG: CcmD family protein [Niabella sp.]